MMDHRMLAPEVLSRWLATAEASFVPAAIDVDQRTAARQRAQFFAAQNAVGGRPLIVDENPSNHPRGDIVLGWVEEPSQLGSPFLVGRDTDAVNSVLVRAARTRQWGNPLTLWFGRLVGVADVDLTGSARATVDQRVYGFRPVNHVRIPLLPLAIGGPAGMPNDWLVQATSSAIPGDNDRLSVDDRTDSVSDGADGIPEIVLRLTTNADHRPIGSTQPVSLGVARFERISWEEQCSLGFGTTELAPVGGQIAADEDGQLHFRRLTSLTSSAVETIRQSLLAIRGEKRIWPLAEWSGDTHCRIINFAAARILACDTDPESGLRIVLQPCLLQTSTALVRASSPRNPWLGKIFLTK
jgi:hypothetical protein